MRSLTGRHGPFWTAARAITFAVALAAPMIASVRDHYYIPDDTYFAALSQDFAEQTDNAQGFMSRDQAGNHLYGKWLASGWAFRDKLSTIEKDEYAMMNQWKRSLDAFKDMDDNSKIEAVNELINKRPYIADKDNWGKSDYWATPIEFLKKGGDCEDFAIAKYYSLRLLGIPAHKMELHIVKDTSKTPEVAHAILIVETNLGETILDNQVDALRMAGTEDVAHYKPIARVDVAGLRYEHREPKLYAAIKRSATMPATTSPTETATKGITLRDLMNEAAQEKSPVMKNDEASEKSSQDDKFSYLFRPIHTAADYALTVSFDPGYTQDIR